LIKSSLGCIKLRKIAYPTNTLSLSVYCVEAGCKPPKCLEAICKGRNLIQLNEHGAKTIRKKPEFQNQTIATKNTSLDKHHYLSPLETGQNPSKYSLK
jgi:hypothetical protein